MMCGAFLFRRLKLANFAAIAAISAVAMPVQAETASLEGRTAIVTPLSLVKIDDLKFGTIISSPVAGTVTISPEDGSRDSTGGVTLIGSSHSRAKLAGRGELNQRVRIRISPTIINLVGPGASMTVTDFTIGSDPYLNQIGGSPNYRIAGPDGVFEFGVGGTLNVGADQVSGVYSGTFSVEVAYF